MKFISLILLTIVFGQQNIEIITQDDSAPISVDTPPMGIIHIFEDVQPAEEENNIFQIDEYKKGMGPMDQFFFKDLFETVLNAFEGLENENTGFLQDEPKTSEQPLIIEAPLFGFFKPLFTVFQTPGDSDFVEIETISINGQQQTKVTKTTTRNGITTTTTEIKNDSSNQQNELSESFILEEKNQQFEEQQYQGQEEYEQKQEQEQENEIINQVNLDLIQNQEQEHHIFQDTYVEQEQQTEMSNTQTITLTIVGSITLITIIAFLIKRVVSE